MVGFAPTLSIEIKVLEKFFEGETIYFDYTISSSESQRVSFIPGFRCSKNIPIPSSQIIYEEIKKDQPIKSTFYGLTVSEDIEPQTCTAYVEILEPFHQKAEKEFKIVTKPNFEIQIFFCIDSTCTAKSKVFVKGEKVYFNYNSNVPQPEVKGKLTAPDGSFQKLTLPTTGGILLNQIGKYALEIEASKEGYKTNRETLELVVLKESPKVIDERICNANGICESERGETIENCPQDCLSPEDKVALEKERKEIEEKVVKPAVTPSKRRYYILGGIGILLILLIIAVVIYFYQRRKFYHWKR
jgi:hypothetical protein